MRVELRAKGRRGIGGHLILDDSAILRAGDLPPAVIDLANVEWAAGAIFGSHPVHVLGKVAHLIDRVPDGKLQLALGRTLRKKYLDLDQMTVRVDQGNGVVGNGGGARKSEREKQGEDERSESTRAGEDEELHSYCLPAAFAEFTGRDSPANARKRAGNFS